MTTRVEKDLQASGYDVSIEDKTKHQELNAFRRVFMFPELKFKLGISQQKESRFFIKIEAEPQHYDYHPDIKSLIGFGITTPVKIVPLEILFRRRLLLQLKEKKTGTFLMF